MYSRAREAMWLTMLPKSVMMAWALLITMTYCGEGCTATSTPRPGKLAKSSSLRTRTAGPKPTPAQATSASSSSTCAPAGISARTALPSVVAPLQPQRPGLENDEAPVLVQGPFDVLGAAVMVFQFQADRGKLPGLLVAEAGLAAAWSDTGCSTR